MAETAAADEMRKLAEISSEQTKTVFSVPKRIIDSIEGITRSFEEVSAKSRVIEDEVKTVGEQESVNRGAMEEESGGRKQPWKR